MRRLLCLLLWLVCVPLLACAASSSELTAVTTKIEGGTRTDYVDSAGRLTMADDLGYASRQTLKDGDAVIETYYDVDGRPAEHSRGYYGRRMEWITETVRRTTYLDAGGNESPRNSGYSVLEQTYEAGKVVSECAYDKEGTPAVYSLGCYGTSMRYDADGHTIRFTYLDANGLPTVNSLGYDTVRRVYNDDGEIIEEWFELGGVPCARHDGYYGLRIVDGERIPVDQNGSRQFRLASILTSMPWLCWLGLAALLLVIPMLPKRMLKIILPLYILFILYMTLMDRASQGQRFNLELFWSYRSAVTSPDLRLEILYNIMVFVPLGAMLYVLSPRCRVMLWPFTLSVIIEVFQLVTGRGFCELDDVFNNTLGGCLGCGWAVLYGFVRGKLHSAVHKSGRL